MKKMSFSKMALVLAMVSAGTMMRAEEKVVAFEGSSASNSTETLAGLKASESELVATSFTRNQINYDLLEQAGKLSMYLANETFTVSYVNDAKQKVAFSFADEFGNILYTDASKKGMFHKRFNIAKLPSGNYTAIIVSVDDYYEKVFEIKK